MNNQQEYFKEKGPDIVAAFFGILSLYTLLQLLVTFYQVGTDESLVASNLTHPLINSADYHLLGVYHAPHTMLAETTLPLHLQGILFAPPKASYAIIASAEGAANVYRVGEPVLSEVTIAEILPNAVILRHNNQLEKLSLPEPRLEFQTLRF